MPELLTEITEIVTGLGMTGIDNLATALSSRPEVMRNVEDAHWRRLDAAFAVGSHGEAFASAWANGRAFFTSPDGLRCRPPLVIEWKGPHQAPGFDVLPADLRVDHVYLVSCKYQSRILANSSPTNLFARRLADRSAGVDANSWYVLAAPQEFAHFYSCVRRTIGQSLLPARHEDLTAAHIRRIRLACSGTWPAPLAPAWNEFSLAVAQASARCWAEQLDTRAREEEMLWRLLRLSAAPYFVLGSSASGPLRLRIGTPWDWRQCFTLRDLRIDAVPAGQPKIAWIARVTEKDGGACREVAGHVEIRWAHGRFSTVEAKIYLDTPHADVPGYFPLPVPGAPMPSELRRIVPAVVGASEEQTSLWPADPRWSHPD